jgi:probable HAF family extracellular repeat protein
MKRLLLLACILLVPVTSAYAQFKFINIDCTAGGETTTRGINNFGEIVGSTGPDQYGNDHAVLIKGGKCIPLAPKTILGTNYSDAFKNNDRGDVVGVVCDDVGCHGFLLTKKGGLTQLDFPGASDTQAFGINEFGTVVGTFDYYDQYGNFIAEHGFVWRNGSFSQLDYPGSGDSSVIGINDFGAMVGVWDSGPTSTGENGFVRTVMGKFINYDVPISGAEDSQPDDINDLGVFVGLDVDADGLYHGFLQAGPWFTSIDYPGAYATTAWRINIFGLIVGNIYNSESDVNNGISHGFLAVADGKDGIAQHLPTPPVPAKAVGTAGNHTASRPHTNARHSFVTK